MHIDHCCCCCCRVSSAVNACCVDARLLKGVNQILAEKIIADATSDADRHAKVREVIGRIRGAAPEAQIHPVGFNQ